jgi:hypothetical protein
MKKYSIILLIGLFASCRTVKTTEQVHEKQKDSISYVERVIIDTLKIPGDKIEIEIPCNELKSQSFSKGRAKVKLEPKGNGYTVIVTCDSIEKLLLSKQREIFRLSDSLKQSNARKDVGLSQWQSFWIVTGKLLMGLLILIAAWKFVRWKLLP